MVEVKIMGIKISIVEVGGESRIRVKSPYHPDFPKYAKNLGGKWDADKRVWFFDPRDEGSVRDLCQDCFGTDGKTEPDLVDCRIRLACFQGADAWFAGRRIARRGARDWPVKLGDGVVVVGRGEFCSSGGSRRNPRITFIGDSITLEVRDVPAVLAQREKEADPENVTILTEIRQVESVTVELTGSAAESLKFLRDELSLTSEEVVAKALAIYCQERKKENVN